MDTVLLHHLQFRTSSCTHQGELPREWVLTLEEALLSLRAAERRLLRPGGDPPLHLPPPLLQLAMRMLLAMHVLVLVLLMGRKGGKGTEGQGCL